MSQLSFFDNEEGEGVLIPDDVISPLESKERLNSEGFNQERDTFVRYVKAIQSYHKCSFFEAREMLLEARNEQKRIMLDFSYFF